MSIDLQELFDREGYDAPPLRLDTDDIVRRGRRVRARRRVVRGTASIVGVAAVGAVALAVGSLALPPTHPDGAPTVAAASTSTATGAPVLPAGGGSETTPPAALKQVSLPDPAPGFPYRRWADGVSGIGTAAVGEAWDNNAHWAAVFGLNKRPVVEVPATADVALPSEQEIGPQVTIIVRDYATPTFVDDPDAHTLPGSMSVAGVTGHFAETADGDGGKQTILYFSTGRLMVEVIGSSGTTKDELVTLGNALQGLQ